MTVRVADHHLIIDLLRAPAVTCAVVSGRCLGGGFEIALACDVIIAADDSTSDAAEGVAAFLEKRSPKWTDT